MASDRSENHVRRVLQLWRFFFKPHGIKEEQLATIMLSKLGPDRITLLSGNCRYDRRSLQTGFKQNLVCQ
jgi:hypothetical protein